VEDASPHPQVLYSHERLGELEPVGRGEEFGHIGGGRRLSNSRGLPRYVGRAFEEERHRDLQDMRDVLQAARAHTVRSLLVFLDLLERDPEPIAELLLGHSEHQPAHPDPAAYVLVDGVGDSLTIACSTFPPKYSYKVPRRRLRRRLGAVAGYPVVGISWRIP